MSESASRSEFEVAHRTVVRAAHRAIREIDRRAATVRFGGGEVEEWLLFVFQHCEVVDDATRADAEALLVARFGASLWHELAAYVEWRSMPDAHQEASIVLLERMRTGSESLAALRRTTVRDVAWEVSCAYAPARSQHEGQGV